MAVTVPAHPLQAPDSHPASHPRPPVLARNAPLPGAKPSPACGRGFLVAGAGERENFHRSAPGPARHPRTRRTLHCWSRHRRSRPHFMILPCPCAERARPAAHTARALPAHWAAQAPRTRVRALYGAGTTPYHLLPGAMGWAAPPPCSRPHPLNKQRGRGREHYGSALRARKQQEEGGTGPWGTPEPPGPGKSRPGSEVPPDPLLTSPRPRRTPPRR